jgi:hypothetical protein
MTVLRPSFRTTSRPLSAASIANHLVPIRRFLFDSGVRDLAKRALCKKIFALHIHSFRAALTKIAGMRASDLISALRSKKKYIGV